ncbi:MAG: 3-oxoacyl-[acyl-carrier-protein] synthase-1 [Myxococcota bacterium]|jgi:3-oxoacyl-[acyl-carrier-protein] synthase-1
MRALAPASVTAYAMMNGCGTTNSEVQSSVAEGRSGLSLSTFPLPFRSPVGRIEMPLPPLSGDLTPYDTRPARMIQHLIASMETELASLRQRVAPNRIGVILGTSTAAADATEQAYKDYVATGDWPESFDVRRQHAFGAILEVVRRLTGASGPAWVVSTACTSSAKTVGSAQRLLATGAIDAAIVGGVDTLCAMTLSGFHSLGALSCTPCRPFSAERSGINIGEGGALMLLERHGDARGFIDSVGESSDAYHISAPPPEGLGARLAMERALALASITASDIDHINAHGTGTRLNDKAEGLAIAALFGNRPPVVSTKGYTGHTLGGAGATEICLALMALESGVVPPSLGAEPLDPNLDINVPVTATTGRFRRAISNSFAFGGNNVSVAVRGA